jgi:hypothetical protein
MTVRTTIRLPDDLMRRAKRKATAEGRTFTALVEEGLRNVIDRSPAAPKRRPVLPRVSTAAGGFAEGYEHLDSPKLATLVQEIEDQDYIERMAKGFK